MTKTTTVVRGTLLAALAVLTATPAQAAPQLVSRAAIPGNWLQVSVTKGDAQSSDTRGTLLMCDPPQGHARAVKACEELTAAAGDIARIPAQEAMCPMLYAPVTASAHGEWNGRPVEYRHTFSNSCALAAQTGSVFALSDQLPNGVPGLRD